MTTFEINQLIESWNHSENSFLIKMHHRFLIDCNYYLELGAKCAKHLWAKDELCMVELMKGLGSILDKRNIPYDKEEWEDYQERLLPNNFYNLFDYFKFIEKGFICKPSEQALNCLETQNLAVSLIWESDLDFILAGEDGCISNYDMYTPIYSYKTDLIYFIPYSVAENWKEGEIIEIVNGREVTEEERQYIEEFSKN